MPSITTWTRLEPRPRAPSLAPTLSARVRDPLWMLTRQWQLGEFDGEDTGSPAWAQLAATTSPFTGWQVDGETTIRPLTAADPIEDLVESEPVTPDLALRVELGQTFLRLLAAQKASAAVIRRVRLAYPLPPLPPRADDPAPAPLTTLAKTHRTQLDRRDTAAIVSAFATGGIALSPAATIKVVKRATAWTIDDSAYGRHYRLAWDATTKRVAVELDAPAELEADHEARRFRDVCAGRAIDGVAIHRAAALGLALLPAAKSGGAAGTRKLAAAQVALAAWVADVYGDVGIADPPAWKAERLEYRLSARAWAPDGGTATLAAHPGRTGAFDWYAFDLAASAPGANPTQSIGFSMIPGHVTFPGAPAARWWKFERGTAPFGEIEPDKRDVAKLVLMDFVLVHGNDWFVLPLDQPVGSLCRIDALVVHDVFGVDTLVERADAAPTAAGELWTLFSTAIPGTADQVADGLLLPPSAAGATQVARATEEIRFLRDEGADLVWAVEDTTENGVGEPWPGHERDQARRAQRGDRPPITADGAPLRYLLQTVTPESWIAFLPVAVDPARGVYRLERTLVESPLGPPGPVAPVGRILRPTGLAPGDPYRVFEEEVPREGVRVTRQFVRSRWTDGSTHLWIARRKAVGTGSGSAGLRLDLALASGRSPDDA